MVALAGEVGCSSVIPPLDQQESKRSLHFREVVVVVLVGEVGCSAVVLPSLLPAEIPDPDGGGVELGGLATDSATDP